MQTRVKPKIFSIKEKQTLDKQNAAKQATMNTEEAATKQSATTKNSAIKKPLWQKIKKEAAHY
jgi:hypothetical protein